MEEFLLKLLEKRAIARVVCAIGAILFFVASLVCFLASYYLAQANALVRRPVDANNAFDPVNVERMFEYGMFYSLGLALFFALGFFWSLSRIPFPRLGWRRLLVVAAIVAMASYLWLADEHAIVWIIWNDYPLSGTAVGILLILAGALGWWLLKQRKSATREL
jgi:hypothetical protein